VDLAFPSAEPARLLGLFVCDEPRNGSTRASDDDLATVFDLPQQARQLRFGLMDVHWDHGASRDGRFDKVVDSHWLVKVGLLWRVVIGARALGLDISHVKTGICVRFAGC